MVGTRRRKESVETTTAQIPIEDAVEEVVTSDHDYLATSPKLSSSSCMNKISPMTPSSSSVDENVSILSDVASFDAEKHLIPSSPHSDLGYESSPSPFSDEISDHPLVLLFPELM